VTRPAARPATVIGLGMLGVAVAQAFGRFTYPVLLPAIQDDLLGSYAAAGFLGTLNLFAYLVGTLAVTTTAHRLEPVRLVQGGLALSAAGLALIAVAPSGVVVGMGLVLTGVAGAVIWLPTPGLAGSVVRPERRGLAMGLVSMGVGLGIVFAGQLAGWVRRSSGDDVWRPVYVVEAAIAVAAVVATLLWLRPSGGGTGKASPGGLGALRSVPGWLHLTVAYAAYGLSYTLFVSFLVAALEDDAGFSSAHAGTVFALLGLAVVVGGVLLGRLSDRVGRRPALVGGFLLMAVCAVGVLVGAEPWVALSAIGFGLSFSGLPAVIAAHLGDHLEPRGFSAAFGTLTLFFGVVQVVGPQLGGWLADATGGFTTTFVLSAAAATVALVACALLPRPTS
jgi:predicted MFS family arabinose efflux permease